MIDPRSEAKRLAERLEPAVRDARELAERLGLDPTPVNYWIVDNEEMNRLIAYEGFQERYPHWRWGMQYERQRKSERYLGGKAFELVNNDDPAHAFLQESNSMADQKAVITHVEAHADFFANNRWFTNLGGDVEAAAMLAGHARRVERIMEDPSVERSEVERWIDHVLCVQDTIDQHAPFRWDHEIPWDAATDDEGEDIGDAVERLGLREEVREEVFDDDWLERRRENEGDDGTAMGAGPESDVLAVLSQYGRQYDSAADRSSGFDDWQREIIEILRREAYYFAPQRMTKVMNEGWASFWESLMMSEAGFADDDEIVDYADHQARVLNAPGMNPYRLGRALWEYIENTANRREVVERLLRVEGITWRSFHESVDFETVQAALRPRAALRQIDSGTLERMAEEPAEVVDHEALERALNGAIDVDRHPWKVLTPTGMAERHYSLAKPQHRGFLARISRSELEQIGRYIVDDEIYPDVETAVRDVDRAAGWKRMHEVRESHNDVTFIDEFLSQEFVDQQRYFAYEYAHVTEDYRATSTDAEDVKRKLLLHFTNFGKPTVAVYDVNFRNRNELLLGHRYTGIQLDVERARKTLERVFELWGRPVNLMTIVKEISEKDLEIARRRNREATPTERGVMLHYDGESHRTDELEDEYVERIAAADIDYDTRPEGWLA